ncbi:metalloprotease, partial [Spiromyces aspiralis]
GNTKLDSRKNAETECYEERTLETGETYFEYTGKPIKVACSDKRPHRIVKLANNLEVFITQDETHEHAAAAMNVMVGFMHDPDELPGLAHFCEHMLFIGTTKYPEVDGFNAYLSKYEGMNNAFTAENRTCYYFTIANAGLEEALDRWAQFFISPLFQAEYVEREAKAVDSEFNNNINNDVWHAFRLNCLMSKLGHPVSKFNIGNYETLVGYAKLRGLDLREELVKFYEKYYSADIMKLAVVGSQSLDQLTEWVVKKFAPIKSRGNAVEPVEDPFGSEQVGKMARLKLNNEGYVLNLLFPLPNLRHMYRECPIGYVENLLSYEGEGSLFSYLEQKGWIKWISSYNHNLAGYSCNLVIAVSMTELGYKNYQKVICDIFSYINLLQQGQLSEEYFNDTKWKHHNQFEFSTPM